MGAISFKVRSKYIIDLLSHSNINFLAYMCAKTVNIVMSFKISPATCMEKCSAVGLHDPLREQ